MLNSYEAIYEHGQVRRLEEQPPIRSARIIVTILEEAKTPQKRRTFPIPEAGQVEILGDIISPTVNEEDWECLKGQ